MTQRYFEPDLPAGGGVVSLNAAEARHATRVMRVSPGDLVSLFDGRGHESAAVVAQVSRNECHLQADAPVSVRREPHCRLHLGIALPKGDRARELVERLTELGVAGITPLETVRTQRLYSEARISKLRRAVIEASKQCGRNVLLSISAPMDAKTFFSSTADEEATRWIAHPLPSAQSITDVLVADRIVAAVGPEGGWDETEITVAEECGFRATDLGPRIYRIETAAAVIAARVATP